MASNLDEAYREALREDAYRGVLHQVMGPKLCTVVDYERKQKDLHGDDMTVHKGKYLMGPVSSQCAILKNTDGYGPVDYLSYKLLKDVHHPSIVRVNNYYYARRTYEERLVLAETKGTFRGWLNNGGTKKFFDESTSKANLSSQTRDMIIDLSGALEYLFNRGIYPLSLAEENLYVWTVGGKALVKMLISKAERLRDPYAREARERMLWDALRHIFQNASIPRKTLSIASSSFLQYIGASSTQWLAGYPDSWTYKKKGCYLMIIMAFKASELYAKLPRMNLHWPRTSSGGVPQLLESVIQYYAKREDHPIHFRKWMTFDYFKLCRHTLKHWFTICEKVKILEISCTDQDGFLAKMEQWDPEVWIKLYKGIGP